MAASRSTCAGTVVDQVLTITNTGTTDMTWTAGLGGTDFQISSVGSTLAPSATAAVTVTPPVPSNKTIISDIITITTDIIGDSPHEIPLTQTPRGDVVTVSPGSADFGSVPITSPAGQSSITLTIVNGANLNSAPAAVAFTVTGSGAEYFTLDRDSVVVAAGQQATVVATFSPGTSTGITGNANHLDVSASIGWAIGDEANCGTGSGSVAATGTATRAMVAGIPSQLDFSLVNCGASAAGQQIVVTNPGSASYEITAVALTNDTYYVLDYPTLPKTVAAGGSATITVAPNAIPSTVASVPDHTTYDGSLRITTNAIDDVPHDVSLLMGARGVIITNALWPTSWNFGTTSVGTNRKINIQAINAGNASATASLANIYPSNTSVFSLFSAGVGSSQTSNVVAEFQPTDAGTVYNAKANLVITPEADRVFCQPLPAGWNSTGTATSENQNIVLYGISESAPPQ